MTIPYAIPAYKIMTPNMLAATRHVLVEFFGGPRYGTTIDSLSIQMMVEHQTPEYVQAANYAAAALRAVDAIEKPPAALMVSQTWFDWMDAVMKRCGYITIDQLLEAFQTNRPGLARLYDYFMSGTTVEVLVGHWSED